MGRTTGAEISKRYLTLSHLRTWMKSGRAASLQFVRKVSGFRSPSNVNQEAFNQAVKETTAITQRLLASLTTKVPSRNREIEAEKARRR